MIKKISIFFSLITLVSCSFQSNDPGFVIDNLKQNQVNSQSNASNWYNSLSPELKSYYLNAKDKQGSELLQALNSIVNKAEIIDYGEATSYIYTVVDNVSIGQKKGIKDAYSNIIIEGDGPSGHKYKEIGDENGDGKKGDSINCEHTWPQSFFNKEGAMRSDLHHLFPTLSTTNSKRGSFAFGLSSEGKVVYSTKSGSKLISLANSNYVFEVSNPQKGDTARALLYFYLRYYNKDIRNSEYDSKSFFINRLPMFENWIKSDPVDLQEKRRNEVIFNKQKNRNPFIDIPDLINIIGLNQFREIEETYLK